MVDLSNALASLEHSFFERVVAGGTCYLMSISVNASGERIWIHGQNNEDVVKAPTFKLADGVAFDVTQADDLDHVEITGVSPNGDLSLNPIPVGPHLYPDRNLHMRVFTNANGQFWGICQDATGQAHTVFKKPDVFGDYWIYRRVNFNKDVNARISEKTQKGYTQVGQNTFEFSSEKRTFIGL